MQLVLIKNSLGFTYGIGKRRSALKEQDYVILAKFYIDDSQQNYVICCFLVFDAQFFLTLVVITATTRRFFWRPSSVALLAMGLVLP